MSKKAEQLDAVLEFGAALHKLRGTGVMLDFQEVGGVKQIIEFLDRETEEHIGEFAYIEALTAVTGQIIDELACAEEYFGDLAKD